MAYFFTSSAPCGEIRVQPQGHVPIAAMGAVSRTSIYPLKQEDVRPVGKAFELCKNELNDLAIAELHNAGGGLVEPE